MNSLKVTIGRPLERTFFDRPTLTVAQDLLGKIIRCNGVDAVITETEAYIGKDDPACHAAKGKTKRTEVMFGQPGHAYVYLIYGMYHCLNFVTETEGMPAAVLIRGVRLLAPPYTHFDGPGKLCKALNITKDSHNRMDMIGNDRFSVYDTSLSPCYDATPRIGIRQGTDKLWRFVVKHFK